MLRVRIENGKLQLRSMTRTQVAAVRYVLNAYSDEALSLRSN